MVERLKHRIIKIKKNNQFDQSNFKLRDQNVIIKTN